jgi:hypothetical protein
MPPSFTNRRVTPKKRQSSLVASSTKFLHPIAKTQKFSSFNNVVEWQKQAWDFYDLIGELRYGARYYGNSISQLRLNISWKSETGAKAEPVDPDNLPEGLDRRQYDIAVDTLSRLHSNEGSVTEILKQFGVNLFVAGEGYLIGRTDPLSGGERWDFYSTEQVVWLNGSWHIKENLLWRSEDLIKLSSEDHLIRIWQPHPRFSDEPDSPMRSILSLCEELLLLSANVRATALSRIPAGILLMPDTMLDAGADYDPENLNNDANREGQAQSALEEIYQHFITPISDPNSAASVAPFILTGDPEDLEQVRLIEFDREVDVVAAEQRKELLMRMAHGIDLPTEVLNGMQSINHWTAWQIEESSYKAHIRPAASLFCSAVTSSLVWPAVQAATGQEADVRLVVGFDPIDLISHIDRRLNAKDGHSSLVISDSTYRRSLGFSEDDAPDEMEYKRRMALQQAALTLTPVAAGELDSVTEALDESVARLRPGAPTPESISADPDPRGSKPDIDISPQPDEPSGVSPNVPDVAVTAAGTPTGVGAKLVAIDRALLESMEMLATSAVKRVLEKAGAKVRSKVSREEPLKAAIASVPSWEVPSVLGEGVVSSLFAQQDVFTSEEFDDFKDQYDSLTHRAQAQVRRIAAQYGLSDYELAELEAKQEAERDAGWGVLIGLLMAATAKLLYKPKVTSTDINGFQGGEFDDVSLVPTRIIRAGLSAAGGNRGTASSGGGVVDPSADRPLGLLATGQTSLEYLEAAGLRASGFRWVYGDEIRQTFEPHLELDGYEFSGWEDQGLINPDSFPSTPYYFPGDHDGCRCLVEYVLES